MKSRLVLFWILELASNLIWRQQTHYYHLLVLVSHLITLFYNTISNFGSYIVNCFFLCIFYIQIFMSSHYTYSVSDLVEKVLIFMVHHCDKKPWNWLLLSDLFFMHNLCKNVTFHGYYLPSTYSLVPHSFWIRIFRINDLFWWFPKFAFWMKWTMFNQRNTNFDILCFMQTYV